MADVQVTRDGGVLTIRLNRPDVLNALNKSVHEGIYAALQEAQDPAIRAVVITGEGRGFCVGQDLQEFKGGAGDVAGNLRSNYHRNVLAIRALWKPVIAAVNGPAAGAGLSLALACDVRIASDAASFVPAFINIGLIPDSGGTWLVRRLLGTARAYEWLTTGRKLSADEARSMGLVSEVVPAAEFEERMHEVAQYFATLPTQAAARTKLLLDAAETTTFAEQLELEAEAQAEMTRTPDFLEGVSAFLEKREARFTGAPQRVHPVSLVSRDDRRRWRLMALVRWPLALPHIYLLQYWSVVALLVAICNWFIALVRGRTPDAVHAYLARYLRYSTHVLAYVTLAADPYPRFRGWEGTYPVDLRIDPPRRQPRWKIAIRLLLAIPALVLSYVLGVVAIVMAVITWFAAILLARAPKGLVDLVTYCLRYQAQTTAYLLLLTDRYPTLSSDTVVND